MARTLLTALMMVVMIPIWRVASVILRFVAGLAFLAVVVGLVFTAVLYLLDLRATVMPLLKMTLIAGLGGVGAFLLATLLHIGIAALFPASEHSRPVSRRAD